MCASVRYRVMDTSVRVVGLSDVVDKAMALLNLVNLVEGFCSKFH